MSKKKGMTPAQKAAARWEQPDASSAAPVIDDPSPEKAPSSQKQAKISLEGLLGPVGLIVIIAVVGFILMFNQGGFN